MTIEHTATLTRLTYAVRQALTDSTPSAVYAATPTTHIDHAARALVAKLTTGVLSEELPPHTRGHLIEWDVPRFATWWDMLCATHRGRWWGRALGLHRRRLRYVDEPMRRRIDVVVRSYWTYPDARRVLPGGEFGHVVLKTATATREDDRWQ